MSFYVQLYSGFRVTLVSGDPFVARRALLLVLAPPVDEVLVPDAPEGAGDAQQGGAKGDPVGRGVAGAALEALHVALGVADRVGVVDAAVQQVEDVARQDGRQGHGAPVLAQAVHAEAVGHQARVDAEEHAIRKARQARDQHQKLRGRHADGDELGQTKHAGRGEQAPEARPVVFGDQNVGADAAEQPAAETAKGQDRDVHGLALFDEPLRDRGVLVFPERLGVVANVARNS